jgi:hypothetical protein
VVRRDSKTPDNRQLEMDWEAYRKKIGLDG